MTLFLQFSRQLVLVHVGVLDQLLLIAVALAYAGDGRQPHQMALSVLVTGDEMDLVTSEGLVYQGGYVARDHELGSVRVAGVAVEQREDVAGEEDVERVGEVVDEQRAAFVEGPDHLAM